MGRRMGSSRNPRTAAVITVAAAVFFVAATVTGGAHAVGIDVNDRLSSQTQVDERAWEQISRAEIASRAEDRKHAADEFAKAELAHVEEMHRVKTEAAHQLSTVLAQLEESKAALEKSRAEVQTLRTREEGAEKMLEDATNKAEQRRQQLSEANSRHARETERWRDAAQSVVAGLKGQLPAAAASAGTPPAVQTGGTLNTVSPSQTGFLSEGEHMQTPAGFKASAAKLLQSLEQKREQDVAARAQKLRQDDDAFDKELKAMEGGMIDMPTFEAQFPSSLPNLASLRAGP